MDTRSAACSYEMVLRLERVLGEFQEEHREYRGKTLRRHVAAEYLSQVIEWEKVQVRDGEKTRDRKAEEMTYSPADWQAKRNRRAA